MSLGRVLWLGLALCAVVPHAYAQFVQQTGKLVGTNSVGQSNQGYAVAISGDGNTAIVGGYQDNQNTGAAWVYTRSGGAWSQSTKLVGAGATGSAYQGISVGLSTDGNTAIVGGYQDDNRIGAAWVYTRSGNLWSQQGPKLVGNGAVGPALQGYSVALSADGNTAILGGVSDENGIGAVWVFTRSGGVWSQQGNKLVGSNSVGAPSQGYSVALSADGNTALVGGWHDRGELGAAWVFTRSAGAWSQQGEKLVGSLAVGSAAQGWSVALSADGNTAAVGGADDNASVGAVWVYTRSGGVWTQQGPKLIGSGAVGAACQGSSVAIQGNTLVAGGNSDNNNVGALWVYTRSGGVWIQQGVKNVGTGGGGSQPYQGTSIALSGDGNTIIAGGNGDSGGVGAAWIFIQPVHFAIATPVSVVAGTPFNITATALDASNAAVTGYSGNVHFTSTDTRAALPADAKLTNGTVGVSAILWTGGSQTISATDSLYPSIIGTSPSITVTAMPPPSVTGLEPAVSSGSNQILAATFTAPGGYQALDVVNVLINNYLDGRQACYLAYSRPSNALYIVADNGNATQLTGKVMDGAGTVGNSQCTVWLGGSAATGSGNTLTLMLSLSFAATFAGNKVVYVAARDLAGNSSGWQIIGMHAVPPLAETFPNATGVNPAWGSSLSQTVTFTYQDQTSAANLQTVWALINTAIDGRGACYVAYYRPGNQLYLYPDTGDGTLATIMVLTGSNALSNSQCTVSAHGASVQSSGNMLVLTLPITFKTAFAGYRGVWLAAQTMGGAVSPWQALGAEEVPGQN